MNITYYSLTDYNNAILIPFTIELEGTTYDDHLQEIADNLEAITERLNDGELREEWIVADYDDIPSHYVGEWSLSEEFFEYLDAMESSHMDAEAFNAGVELGIPLDSIEDAYHGEYRTDSDFASEYIDSMGVLSDMPESLIFYFDYELYARDLMMDFNEHGGHYFSSNY